MAAVPSDGIGEAKDTFDEIRTSVEFPFVINYGNDSVLLNNSHFSELVDYLHDVCGWSKMKIDNMLRHYDVYNDHTF